MSKLVAVRLPEELAEWLKGQPNQTAVVMAALEDWRAGHNGPPRGGEAPKERAQSVETASQRHTGGGSPEPTPLPVAANNRFARAHPDWCRCPSCRSILTKERLAKEGIG
jgi:hypothetical protein